MIVETNKVKEKKNYREGTGCLRRAKKERAGSRMEEKGS